MKKYLSTLLLALSVFASLTTVAAPYHGREMIVRLGMSKTVPSDKPADVSFFNRPVDRTLVAGEDTQTSLSFQYFFDRSWAFEFMTALPFEHDLTYTDNSDEEPLSTTIGSYKQVPLTFSALYYLDNSWFIKPYAGLGFNYSFFYGEKVNGISQNTYKNLKLEHAHAFTAQLGLDFQVSKNWSLNTSARYYDLDTKTTFTINSGTRAKANMDLNPLVYSVMIGYKF